MNYKVYLIYAFLILSSIFSAHTETNSYKAVFFCNDFNQIEAFRWAEKNALSFISFVEKENALLVSNNGKNISLSPEVCFSSKMRTAGKHLAFSRNEIIVRIKSGSETSFRQYVEENQIREVEKHAFIPNQYLLKNIAQNEAELEHLNDKIKKESWFKVGQINTVHTLSVSTVDDPLFERQWSIKNDGTALQGNGIQDADMQVDSAWTKTTGSGIKIAILDSGVDTLHEDLIQNLFPGYDAFADSSQNTFGFPTPNYDSDGHGTACAGITAAAGDNAMGIAGVAYDANIIPIRIFYYQDYGSGIGIQASTNSNALINGSAYAWRVANSDIMSTSAGLPDIFIAFLNIDTEVMNAEIAEAFNKARNGKGIAMFFSSGNEDENKVLWPAVLENTIAVGASSMCDERKNPNDCSPESWGSSYGANLDFVAPGVRVSSTDMTGSNGYNNNDYTFTFNGTSAACPNAAGVGALVLSVNPNLHARDIKAIMSITAHKDTLYQFDSTFQHGTWNEEVGYGRVDAFEAVKLAETYNSTVGITQNTVDNNLQLKVYPNPSRGNIFIENKLDKTTDIKVFNLEGKQMADFQLSGSGSKNLKLSKGLYFISQISGEKLSNTQKLIIY